MSIFEALMLLCFGVSWPFAIAKSYRTRRNGSKSVWFLGLVFVGYLSGLTHKLLYSRDVVTFLYAANGAMVFIDILLYLRNARLAAREGDGDGITAGAPAP